MKKKPARSHKAVAARARRRAKKRPTHGDAETAKPRASRRRNDGQPPTRATDRAPLKKPASGRLPRHAKPAARRRPTTGFRLSTDVQPIEYRVDLAVEPARGTFGGEVLIRLALARPRQTIELHAADIQVRTATLASPESAGPPARGRILRHPDRETVEIRLPRRVGAGQWTLRLRFTGRLQEGLRGLYGVHVDGDAYAFTQLEAADARRFFPCFDEPGFKARFTFRVTTDATYTVLSNSPPATIQQQEGNRTTVEFGPTPKLSTYLCALAVGALESSAPRHLGSTPIRVWHVPGKGHLTDLALDAAVATLTRLEQYFDLPYPYDKLDLVAVPDFEAGAMENAGAVFFRETLLLADPATITLAEHKRLAEVIAHELAHMWYGNLVTMTWWNDLWLNEAFATWMAFRIVDDWKPGWRMWNNFEHHRAAALSLDALVHTHPIYADVRNVSEATENFDAITYEKGAAVVRMIERYLGAEPFRDGVRLYIRRHRDGNATARDLWQALSETSGKQVEHIVRTWIETPGFPLLTVRDDNDEATVGFAVSHERFFANPHTAAGGRRQQWPIPWVVKYQATSMAQPATARHLIQTRRDHLFLDAANPLRWYYANADQAGFYRVRHDDGNLKSLALALQTALTPVERMGLLSDQWALVRNGGAPIETFLRLASGCHNETDHDVLEELAGALSFIEDHLLDAAGPGARQAFHAWVTRLFMPQLIHCGWDAKPAESDDTRLRRAAVVRILAEVAHAPTVSSTAAARAMRYLDDRTSLDANLVDTAVFVGGRDGDADRFERYRAALREARTPQERRRFQLALAAFRLPELIDRTLGLTLTDEVPTQDVALVLIRAFANPAARERTWRFITRRWTQLRRRLPPMMIARVIEATPALQTPAMMREVAAFFGTHPVPTATRALRQALERFELNNELRRRTAPGLARWLAET